MEKIIPQNFRGLKKVVMAECVEGEGTPDDYSRIVKYFYDAETLEYIGKIDPFRIK